MTDRTDCQGGCQDGEPYSGIIASVGVSAAPESHLNSKPHAIGACWSGAKNLISGIFRRTSRPSRFLNPSASSIRPSLTLLPPLKDSRKKTLVLDLDETLVHSSFDPVPNPDFVIPLEIDGIVYNAYVLMRPGLDEFLEAVGHKYEIVVFTASLSKYADPLLDRLDRHRVISKRLFREACVVNGTAYVKDLAVLGRDLRRTLIVDNAPHSFAFHPYNAICIDSWYDDPADRQLYELARFLDALNEVDDVSAILDETAALNGAQNGFVLPVIPPTAVSSKLSRQSVKRESSAPVSIPRKLSGRHSSISTSSQGITHALPSNSPIASIPKPVSSLPHASQSFGPMPSSSMISHARASAPQPHSLSSRGLVSDRVRSYTQFHRDSKRSASKALAVHRVSRKVKIPPSYSSPLSSA